MARSSKSRTRQSQLRIIGGQWRSRRLNFTPSPGLRPTTDRVRETLFNWLGPTVPGASCADLFAGSGALGLEALSRGADHCDFVDTSGTAIEQIEAHLKTLEASQRGSCHLMPADRFLSSTSAGWDLVFVDPPFGMNLVNPTLTMLEEENLLREEATIYVETALQDPAPVVPANWSLHREKKAGGVIYRLFTARAR